MLLVGTCGWDYPHWRGGLYPRDLPHDEWLRWYASGFGAVELDTTFYRLPSEKTVARWARRTPEDFRIAVKASRYLTHVRRLHDPQKPLARLHNVLAHLGPRLGPVVLQLPPNAPIDLGALTAALDAAREHHWRVAVEPRHPSWFTDRYFVTLQAWGATSVWTDWWGHVNAHRNTAPWCYVRLHAGRAHPTGAYGDRALHHWAERLAAAYGNGTDVYVMFNNDAHGCAPRNAARFAEICRAFGLHVTRAPSPTRVPLVA